MEPEFVQMIIANFPNFAGLIILAVVQWKTYQKTLELLDECLEKDND